MNNQQQREKPSFQEQLYSRCSQWWDEHIERPEHPRPEDLFDFVKQVALESWRNGVETGRKRATGNAPQGHAPRAQKVYRKGSALKNGKLRPAERDLVVEEEEG